MGHKKRNVAPPRPKQSLSPVASPAADVSVHVEAEPSPAPIATKVDALVESVSSSCPSVKLECERALTSLRRGNHTKALRLMKESCCRYENTPHAALIHRVQGTVCVKVASIIDDPNAKHRHLKNAIESARRAVELSPNSVEFAHFYANLLFEVASEAKEYEEVVMECERALSIENPIDPAKESLQEVRLQRLMSPEARINNVQGELRNLIQKCNFASISTWMKNLGGDEKFRLIPIRRATEDPMELRLVQARRPNEIKKATKTPEERRKEIEVRVAAARLLQQQKSEAADSPNDSSEKGLELSGSGPRSLNDRRKHGKKVVSPMERKDSAVRSYWSSLSNDKKKEWLTISVSDINAHFLFLKEVFASEVISEAVGYAEANKTWSLWVCSQCREKFSDAESHLQHVMQGHLANILPKIEMSLPRSIDDEWVEMIHNCSWKPVDVPAMIRILGNQQNYQDFDAVGLSSLRQRSHGFADASCAWDSSIENDDTGNNFSNGLTAAEINDFDKETVLDSSRHNGNHVPLADCPPDKWPLCDDTERAKLLDKIRTLFEALIGHKCLSDYHLSKVLQFTMEELQGLSSCPHLLSHEVKHTPICVCFLEASQLKKIMKFLQDVSSSCGLGRFPEKNTSPVQMGDITNQCKEIDQKIILTEEGSSIILDETLFGNISKGESEEDDLLAWIYSVQSSEKELLESWVHRREEKLQQHSETFQLLEKELFSLQTLCDRKSELVGHRESLHFKEELCVEEGKREENNSEMSQRKYAGVLIKQKEELLGYGNDDTFGSSNYQAVAVKSILREEGSLNVNQFGDEDAYTSPLSYLPDLESGENHDMEPTKYLHQVNGCLEIAMHKQKDASSFEVFDSSVVQISRIDACMMKTIMTLQQLECKMDTFTVLDYRWILVPLIKLYMKTRIEDLAEKDAIKKSDAAREAFLAELALDSSKGVRGGTDNTKHGIDKAKDKKRHKEHKKAKASRFSEHHSHSPETNEPDSFTVSSDGDHPDSKELTAVHADELKEQEEEIRRMELEAEERKLEETLEYQRRIENEAKERQLAEQQKNRTQTQQRRSTEGFPNSICEPLVDDHEEVKWLKRSIQRDDNPHDVLPIAPLKSWSPPIFDTQKAKTIDHIEDKRGVNGDGVPSNGIIYSEQRTGRRGRRQRNSARMIEEKAQSSFSSGKENLGVCSLEGSSYDNTREDVNNLMGDHDLRTSRKFHLKEEDEERFQADLKKAVRQSLDACQAHKLPSPSSAVQKKHGTANGGGCTPNKSSCASEDGSDMLGPGLQNEVGEYNCFLNVIIQSLWHLRRFRDEFLKRSSSDHVHVGDPCVICALYEVFHALNFATADSRREAVAPTSLRMALSNLYPESNFFQKGQMNDASEVLGVIFDCLHQSFVQLSNVSDNESVESNTVGTWDCKDIKACLVHSLFGMNIFERMNCYNCSLESRHLKYTSFFHNINASSLRTAKEMSAGSSFDDLLDLVERNHQLACDPDGGGCGKLNHIHHFLSSTPHVFTTVLGWRKARESPDDIAATLAALSTEIDMSVLYRGLDPKHIYSLVSVVCYYGRHYHCFAYSHDHDRWIMYDDANVKVIGGWADVLAICEKGHLQPQVLFFEAVR
ncbi:hypothetical protein SAY86_016084 [Trapa natans]|uniref:USP domain-containing protein n=1 Tax=Trapa natans TaxID=22666 RepID=A0AAN7QWU7_TRANT|nr:hypothetical protein SAY86_016084 [Trapa natans]